MAPRSARRGQASQDTQSLLGSGRHQRNRTDGRGQRNEMDAAFDSDDENQPAPANARSNSPPAYDTAVQSGNDTASSSRPDVFFDAGDAMHDEPAQPSRAWSHDPLGAGDADDGDQSQQQQTSHPTRSNVASSSFSDDRQAYDFEGHSYFNGANGNRSRSASLRGPPHSATATGGNDEAGSSTLAYEEDALGPASASQSSGAASGSAALARSRLLLGHFGRFVGMRLPGASYSSVATDDGTATSRRSRRVMGGGMGQDGVFGNLNAKPDGRRRRNRGSGDPDDRGEDDDIEDETLPPTYEVAAADAAPGYWETTIAPGGLGWTPGGGHVGEVEDLILEGLPIGNFFGFAWNLLVSMCFQFVGFLLTYLLHTTHAARCGSRAGLGITLIQYGFYLRTRALQLADENNGAGDPSGHSGGAVNEGPPRTIEFFGATIVYGNPEATPTASISASARDFVTTATASSSAAAATGTDMASAFAANANASAPNGMADDPSGSSEWLAYLLMIIGWFLLLSSLLSYWRVHRWGQTLVASSRREQDAQRAAENGGQPPENADGTEGSSNAPIGFIHRLREILGPPPLMRPDGRSTGTGEDWIIYPGSTAGARSPSAPDDDSPPSGVRAHVSGSGSLMWGAPPRRGHLPFSLDDSLEAERNSAGVGANSHLSPEERRLLRDMRSGGLM